MRCIGFIGKTNKTEIVQYVAKIINSLGNKVMVIDATMSQKQDILYLQLLVLRRKVNMLFNMMELRSQSVLEIC